MKKTSLCLQSAKKNKIKVKFSTWPKILFEGSSRVMFEETQFEDITGFHATFRGEIPLSTDRQDKTHEITVAELLLCRWTFITNQQSRAYFNLPQQTRIEIRSPINQIPLLSQEQFSINVVFCLQHNKYRCYVTKFLLPNI